MSSTTRRHWFGGPAGEFVASLEGTNLAVVAEPNAVLWFWDAKTGGNRITDLLNESLTPVTEVTAGPTGVPPRFQARIGDTQIWAGSPLGGDRVLMLATDLDADLASAEATLSTLETPALDDLVDVSTAGATNGQVLGFNGSTWGPTAGGGGVTSVNGQTGVVSLSAANVGAAATAHQHAASDVVSGTLDVARLPVGSSATQVAAGNHTHTLDALSDVSTLGAVAGNTIVFNGTQWTPGAGGGSGVTDHGALTGLADDDHPQYLNNTRGDVRYLTRATAVSWVNVVTGNESRPDAGLVLWVGGTVEPANILNGDIWFSEGA